MICAPDHSGYFKLFCKILLSLCTELPSKRLYCVFSRMFRLRTKLYQNFPLLDYLLVFSTLQEKWRSKNSCMQFLVQFVCHKCTDFKRCFKDFLLNFLCSWQQWSFFCHNWSFFSFELKNLHHSFSIIKFNVKIIFKGGRKVDAFPSGIRTLDYSKCLPSVLL